MSFDDFCREFTRCIVCRVPNTSFFTFHKTWDESVARGEWSESRAGGCSNFASYLNNPQFIFSVHEDGEVMLALMQKNKSRHFREGRVNHSIGFQVWENGSCCVVHSVLLP